MSENRAKFRDRFDPEAWSAIYESSSLNASQLSFYRATEIVRSLCLLRSKPGEVWLDIGCGAGHFAGGLAASGLKVIGLDHDSNMIDAAKQRFPKLDFLQVNAMRLPFTSDSVNGVVAVSVMGCFESPENFYKETYRVLHSSGTAIFTCTNRSSLLLKVNSALKPATSDSFHLYTLSEVNQDLQNTGFKLVDYLFYNFFLNPGKNPIPSFRFSKLLERFGKSTGARWTGRNFVVVAQKV